MRAPNYTVEGFREIWESNGRQWTPCYRPRYQEFDSNLQSNIIATIIIIIIIIIMSLQYELL